MGNHSAGRAMDNAAKTAWMLIEKNRVKMGIDEQEIDALYLLDYICGSNKGCDAEFEVKGETYTFSTDPQGPLGRLISIAFGDGRDWAKDCDQDADRENDKAWNEWYSGPEKLFSDRYDFH